MRKLFLSLILFFAILPIANAGNFQPTQKHGYTGDVTVGTMRYLGNGYDSRILFMTSHGCTLNNGLYIGGGIGFDLPFGNAESVQYLFADTKYIFEAEKFYTFVRVRIGASYGQHGDNVFGIMMMPEVGVQYKRFSLSLGHMYDSECFQGLGSLRKFHSNLMLSFTF